MKTTMKFLLLLLLPIISFVYFHIASTHQDTNMHEKVHSIICSEINKGTPEVKIDFWGNGVTRCFNSSITKEGQILNIQNEIVGYNTQSLKTIGVLIVAMLVFLFIKKEDV